jgi:predicted nucleotidyltransferase
VLATDLDRDLPAAPKDGRGRDLELGTLRPLLARIIERWHPLQIWLFGSRARGDALPTSDWDIFVVAPDDVPDRELDDPLIGWRLRRESGVRADVITCRARDFEEERSTPNTMALEVATDGVLLYER